jgi:hypothetical protein
MKRIIKGNNRGLLREIAQFRPLQKRTFIRPACK